MPSPIPPESRGAWTPVQVYGLVPLAEEAFAFTLDADTKEQALPAGRDVIAVEIQADGPYLIGDVAPDVTKHPTWPGNSTDEPRTHLIAGRKALWFGKPALGGANVSIKGKFLFAR